MARRTRRAGRNRPSMKPKGIPTQFDREPKPERRHEPLPAGKSPHPDGGYVGICTGTCRDGDPCLAEFWDPRPLVTLCSSCRIGKRGRRPAAAETLRDAA